MGARTLRIFQAHDRPHGVSCATCDGCGTDKFGRYRSPLPAATDVRSL